MSSDMVCGATSQSRRRLRRLARGGCERDKATELGWRARGRIVASGEKRRRAAKRRDNTAVEESGAGTPKARARAAPDTHEDRTEAEAEAEE